jgi:hypothetical protein
MLNKFQNVLWRTILLKCYELEWRAWNIGVGYVTKWVIQNGNKKDTTWPLVIGIYVTKTAANLIYVYTYIYNVK